MRQLPRAGIARRLPIADFTSNEGCGLAIRQAPLVLRCPVAVWR
jgi:hypothetical protein